MIERHAGSVMVVDDDPTVLKVTSLLLEKRDFSVSASNSAREALDVLQKNEIDVVLTDIMMPEMSGIELLERIRSIDPDIPVILITGYADLEKAIDAIKKGAFDFITKPYDSAYLAHSIEKAVTYHKLIKSEAGYRHILEELNNEVETLIAERTMSLMALTVADKVRNPATTIAWTCKRILEKDDSQERLKQGLNVILSEAEKLEAIVKDFQELFRARGTSFKHGDVKDVVEGVISVAEKDASHKGIDLTAETSGEPLRMNMESNILRMALLHLVRNAIEATPAGGRVMMKTYGDNEKVVVEVSDTGPGIPEEEMEKIFEPFFSTKKHRFGMGLSVVKQIVSEHLGEITVESEMGKGTTFKLIFPVRWTERIT
jgi:signal transduction histidine kinase